MAWPYVEVIGIKSEGLVAALAVSRWHLEFHIFVGNVLLLVVHSGSQIQGSTEQPGDRIPLSRRFAEARRGR